MNGHKKLETRMNIKGGQTCNKNWINGGPTKWGGAGLDKEKVIINENYNNYIQYNPKLVRTVYELSVVDKETTGHYLTLDLPYKNKNWL